VRQRFEAEPDRGVEGVDRRRRWPEWDVSKEMARLDGPFEPGVSGWAKQRGNLGGAFYHHRGGRRAALGDRMPRAPGQVIFDHSLEPVGGGHVRVVKRVGVQGGFGPLLRLFAPKMRREIAESLAALQRQVSP
jgi:hypothetical protein